MTNSYFDQANKLINQFCVAMKGAPDLRNSNLEAQMPISAVLKRALGSRLNTSMAWELRWRSKDGYINSIAIGRTGSWEYWSRYDGKVGLHEATMAWYKLKGRADKAEHFDGDSLDKLRAGLERMLDIEGRRKPW